ncbi:ThiF family adenylyltransferase [Microvirga sp. STR05]|uniref:ThiF family adenylyltransferase n=1 Tax=Hymenobacter duratus TaxID=2771356 RepID=A0ABR8JNY8_9BACT|nr:ThiF family adenylyltransferase [Hymenobacter duratus]MBD2717107.1 ThiF family adenylyltransferase [Hymenobacter duratus]MBR7952023.1 ThiF family adenylyltransferase [Microvirga sp. STR05]
MEPTAELLLGRRHIEGVSGYELVDDFEWSSKNQRWVLQFQLTLPLNEEGVNGIIPNTTRWYLLVSSSYPQGEIDIYPAKEDGITVTFQHQNYNHAGGSAPWRKGNLCVNTGLRSFSRRGYDSEPYDPAKRLRWHIQRCKLWLELANIGQLSVIGEPLELPHYPTKTLKTIAFSENAKSFANWQLLPDRAGLVRLKQLNAKLGVFYTESFQGKANKTIVDMTWGTFLTESNFSETSGIWIMLKDIVVLEPWQAPATWEELAKIAENQNIDIIKLARETYCKAWKFQPSILLLGFPIPEKVGEDPIQLHWLAVQLDKPPTFKGFRPKSAELPKACASYIFRKTSTIEWLTTENWDRAQVSSRGKLPSSIIGHNILVIGAGSLGSALVELLARAGCIHITVLDNDILEVGNMARHVLTLDDLKKSKSESLVRRVNKIFPSINAVSNTKSIREALRINNDFLLGFSLIIDATASDQVLYELARANFLNGSIFASFSLGLYAHRVFCYTAPFHSDIDSDFNNNMDKWMEKEQAAYHEAEELPRDGLGCWHPLFPARSDDVWMLTAVALKTLESFIINEVKSTSFSVFEQSYIDGAFAGIIKAKL